MRNIGVLTYNIAHRKTYDTLSLLKAKGYEQVTVYAMPLHYKKSYKPLVQHRPELTLEIPNPGPLVNNLGYKYVEKNSVTQFDIPKDEILLLCGAGILPDSFISEHVIINSHPGYIPLVRGLDSFKWAIYEGLPIGVTTHLIGEEVDAGYIIERKLINVEKNDTFHTLAYRVYENEINLLVRAIEKIEEPHEFCKADKNILHKRMPHEYEKELEKKMKEYKFEGVSK